MRATSNTLRHLVFGHHPSDLSSVDPKFIWSAVLLRDALKTREQSVASNIELRLTARSSKRRLRFYRVAHNPWWKRFVWLMIVVDLCLAIVEAPSSFSTAWLVAPWITQLIELACQMCFLADLILKCTFLGVKPFVRDPWNAIRCVLVLLSLLELQVVFCLGVLGIYSVVRVSRFYRPFFLFEGSKRHRRILLGILYTVYQTAFILAFLAIFMFVYSFLGLICFAGTEEGRTYFPSFDDSLMSLFTLLTTANYPDVMMPAYTTNPWSSLFFIFYLLIALYFLTNLLMASIYNYYREHTVEDVERRLRARSKSVRSAFNLMKDPETNEISVEDWITLLQLCQPKRSRAEVELLFHLADRDSRGALRLSEFIHVCDFMDVRVKPKKPRSLRRVLCGFDITVVANIIRSKYFDYFIAFMILVNAITAVVESYECAHLSCSGWDVADYGFTVFFVMETLLKLIALGLAEIKSKWRYWTDTILNFALLLAGVSELITVRILPGGENVSLIKWTLLLRSCLLFRLFSNFKAARKIIASLVRLGPALLCFLSALLAVYYFWAILGMELYWNLLQPDNPALADTLYARSDYFANNFNSFLRTLVLLFELMVVNNWFIVNDAIVHLTSKWSRLYFVFFLISTVYIIVNLFVAFLIEAFLSQYQLQLKSNSIKQNLLDSIVRAEQARSRSRGESPICWTVAQKKRLFRLYLDMFNAKTFDEFAEESVPPERREAGMDHLSESGAVTPSPYVVDLDEPLDVFELAELGEV